MLTEYTDWPRDSDDVGWECYWARRGGFWAGKEGRAKSTNPHDSDSPARRVFDECWEKGHAERYPHQCWGLRRHLLAGAAAISLAVVVGFLVALVLA
jgi:hypothetical protein